MGAPAKTTADKSAARREQAAALHESITAKVAQLTDTDAWAAYLTAAAAFHSYSFNNVMLIFSQAPDASQVAGFRKWQELGRQVRKGEKSIDQRAQPPPRTSRPRPPALQAEELPRSRPQEQGPVQGLPDSRGPQAAECRPNLRAGAAGPWAAALHAPDWGARSGAQRPGGSQLLSPWVRSMLPALWAHLLGTRLAKCHRTSRQGPRR